MVHLENEELLSRQYGVQYHDASSQLGLGLGLVHEGRRGPEYVVRYGEIW